MPPRILVHEDALAHLAAWEKGGALGNLTATYTRLYAPVDGAFPDGLWREVIVRTVNLQNYLNRGFEPALPEGKVLEETVIPAPLPAGTEVIAVDRGNEGYPVAEVVEPTVQLGAPIELELVDEVVRFETPTTTPTAASGADEDGLNLGDEPEGMDV